MDMQAENCAKCGCLPDDILTLTCNHDLCLPCAARNLQREVNKYGDGTKTIMCELCGAPTILDESSVEELLKIPFGEAREQSSYVYSPGKQYSGYPSPMENRIPRTPLGQSQEGLKYLQNETVIQERPSHFSESRKGMRAFCIEHPDEEISYYCFDCLANCICPECVIHGAHKNHDVLTVKKSYPIVRNKVEDALNLLNGKLDEEKILEDKFNNSKRDMRENNKVLKKQVGDIFQEIRNRIDKKEKEIMNIMDTALEDASREIDLFVKTLENKASAVRSTFDLIKNHLTARDEVLLLNFYANNNHKLKQQLESEEINFKKLHESYVPKVPMNFNEIIDSLSILQVQISAIGNVGAEKFRNYPATNEYNLNYSTNGDLDSKENRRLRKDPSKKDYFPTIMSTYTTNPNTRDLNRSHTPESVEKVSKGGANFRNFQNLQNPLAKANLDNKNTSYSGYDRFK